MIALRVSMFKANVAWGLVVLLLGSSCSPLQRRTAGGAVAGLGAATMAGGAVLADPCSLERDYEQRHCRETTEPRFGAEGMQTMEVGLGVVAIGGLLYLSGLRYHHARKPKPWPL